MSKDVTTTTLIVQFTDGSTSTIAVYDRSRTVSDIINEHIKFVKS